MRTQFCKNCNLYKPEPNRSGKEWMNSDGWCTLVRLNPRQMKTAETNWCDGWVEKPVPVEELIHGDAVETPPEFKGLADHIPDAEIVPDGQTYENWRATMRDQIAEVQKHLRILNALIDQPIGDLE